MRFNMLINEIKKGYMLEDICERLGFNLVECNGNEVYYDSDFEEFFETLGAEVEDFGVGYAVISTVDGKYYEVPYEEIENRFDAELENEIILTFEFDKIYDVTEHYI